MRSTELYQVHMIYIYQYDTYHTRHTLAVRWFSLLCLRDHDVSLSDD